MAAGPKDDEQREEIERSETLQSGQHPSLAPELGVTLQPDDAAMVTIQSSPAHPTPVSEAAATLDESAPRYERTGLLGEGGMGKVWVTRDGRIGRRVAMKTVRQEGVDASTRARFLREARVQGQLEHPAVVPVYDLGTSPEGEVYFTMKRVRGETLYEVLTGMRKGDAAVTQRFTLRRLLTSFAQVCLAVDFAHERGVLHRDLKPENIIFGDHGEVYVLDWGVARVLRDDLDAATEISTEDLRAALATSDKTGLVGTPGYIAPEQLRGRPIGPSADVFALGAILVEMLTLKPLHGAGPVLSRLEKTMNGVDAEELIAQCGRDVPPELTAVCSRATRSAPAERTPTARQLHDEIDAYLEGERDLLLRRQLAERHLEAGRAAMARSGDDVEALKAALRETGRALAIAPDHPEARAQILQLFGSTPTATPPEVEDAIERERAHQSRITAKTGALGMASMLLFLPVLFLLGVRSWLGVGVFFAMTGVAVAISAIASRQERRSATLLYLVVFFNNLVFGLCAGLYGPLVLVPAMVITNTIAFALHLDGWPRRFAILSGCLAVGLPVLLSALEVTPASYLPMGDGILLRPLWLAFPPTATLVFITIGTLIAVVNGARSVALVRDALTMSERRVQMQRWQLQQLLPDERPATPKS